MFITAQSLEWLQSQHLSVTAVSRPSCEICLPSSQGRTTPPSFLLPPPLPSLHEPIPPSAGHREPLAASLPTPTSRPGSVLVLFLCTACPAPPPRRNAQGTRRARGRPTQARKGRRDGQVGAVTMRHHARTVAGLYCYVCVCVSVCISVSPASLNLPSPRLKGFQCKLENSQDNKNNGITMLEKIYKNSTGPLPMLYEQPK